MSDDGRKSPEFKEHLKKVGFQKGHEKKGGRKALPKELKEAMRERTFDALDTMIDLMENSPNPVVKLKAAQYLLDPFISKAPVEKNVNVNHSVSIADMLAEINQQRQSKLIDVTPRSALPKVIEEEAVVSDD